MKKYAVKFCAEVVAIFCALFCLDIAEADGFLVTDDFWFA